MKKNNRRFSYEGVWKGDSGYHGRHERRSLKRAERIACHIKESRNFLDVGCNEGLVSECLLRSGKVSKATGVEISDAKVSGWLSECDKFTFVNGDVLSLEFEEKFDCIFYGAVHHHVVREAGFDEALKIFQKLAGCCEGKIFFETGQLTEGGRWEWQRNILKRFSNDEEHIWYLLQSIEPILQGFKVIGRYWIHGVRRYLCEISVSQKSVNDKCSGLVGYSNSISDDKAAHEEGLGWLDVGESKYNDFGPDFLKVVSGEADLFVKRRNLMRHFDIVEFDIGISLPFDWAVKPLKMSGLGLVFPWISGQLFRDASPSAYDPKEVKRKLDQVIVDAKTHKVFLPPSLLRSRSDCSLFDVVDFNPENFFIVDGEIKVVDFEYFSDRSAARNFYNFSKLYFSLGERWVGLKFWIIGVGMMLALSVKDSCAPFEVRVLRRAPSLLSWLGVKVRTAAGLVLIKVIPALSEK